MDTRRKRGNGARLLACAAAVIAVLVLSASPAAGHATLESTTPPSGALLPSGAGPSGISLKFDSNVAIPKDAVRVLGASGRAVSTAAPRHDPDGSTVTVALPALADGGYVVTWRVVSSDAHILTGAFTFTVGDASQALSAESVPGSSQDSLVGVVFGIDRFLAFGAVLLFLGGAFFVRISWSELAARHAIRTTLGVAWAVAAGTAVLGIGLQGLAAAGKPLSSLADLSLAGDVMETDYGRALAMRLVLLIVLVPLVRRLPRRGPRVLDAVAMLLGIGVFATFVYSGHAHAGRWVALAMPVDVAHLAAAAAWLGGLGLLAAGLALTPRPLGGALAAKRFATLAPIAIAVVVLTGLTQSLRQVGGWSPLVDTSYGRLLGVKAILVAAVLLVAIKSRSVVRTRLAVEREPRSGQAARKERKAEARDLTDLRNTVAAEVAFAVVVLVLTTLLTNAPPARDEASRKLWPGAPFATEVKKDGVTFRLAVNPGHTGTNRVVVTPRAADGQPASLLDMRGAISQPDAGIARINIALPRGPDGTYTGRIDIPIAGLWTLDVFAFETEVDETVVTATVPIGTATGKQAGGADVETASPAEMAAVVTRHRSALSQLLEQEPAVCDATGTPRAGCAQMLRDLAVKSVALARDMKELNVAHEVESLTHFTIEAAETFAHFVGRYVDAGCAASTPPAQVHPECRQGPQTYRAPATDLIEKMAAWDLHARAR